MRVPSGGGNWNHPEWRRRLERAPPLRLVDRPLPPIRHVQTGQSVGGRRAAHHGRRKNIGETSLWKPVSHGDHSKDREAQLACGRSSGAARATRSRAWSSMRRGEQTRCKGHRWRGTTFTSPWAARAVGQCAAMHRKFDRDIFDILTPGPRCARNFDIPPPYVSVK